MLRRLAALLLTGLAAVACVPQDPFSPVAVELGQQGTVKILQTNCDLDGVVQVEIVGDNGDALIDEKDPRYWRVDFKSPAKIRGFETAVVPVGGEERVPWRKPERDQALVARVQTASGLDFTAGFSLGELGNGKVRYQARTLTREKFEKEVPCAVK